MNKAGKLSFYFRRGLLCTMIVVLVLFVYYMAYEEYSAMPCPTRGSLDGQDVPVPFLGSQTYRAFGGKLHVKSSINDPSVRIARTYHFKNGVLEETKTRRMFLTPGRMRTLSYRFPIEEDASYQIFLEAEGQEYVYRYCICTISDETNMEPTFPLAELIDVFDLEGTYLYTVTEEPYGVYRTEKKEEAFSAFFQEQALDSQLRIETGGISS